MRCYGTVIALSCATAVILSAAMPARAETWALLVGVSKYRSPTIASLKFPSKDAQALKDAFVNIGKVPDSHIKLLTDDEATRDNILSGVTTFLKSNVKPGDDVLISFAGHGVAKGVGLDAKSYFLGTDALGGSKAQLESSAVSLRDLCSKISELPARQFVLLDDACREDPTPGRRLKPNSRTDTQTQDTQIVPKEGMRATSVTFYACQVGQRAYEDATKEHGVFTYYILEAIKKAAGADANGRIEMGVLASYVSQEVTNWAKSASIDQTPELTSNYLDTGVTDPVYVLKVPKGTSSPVTPLKPVLVIDSDPDTAVIYLNGAEVKQMPAEMKEGENTVRVAAVGFKDLEKKISALPGYQYQMIATLTPSGSGAPSNSSVTAQMQEAQTLESQSRWDDAIIKYQALTREKYAPAYERLAALQQRQGLSADDKSNWSRGLNEAISTLVRMNRETTPSAHSYYLLSRAYSSFALRDAARVDPKPEPEKRGGDVNIGGIKIPGGIFGGKKKKPEQPAVTEPAKAGEYRVPENGGAAAALARKAADDATQIDAKVEDSYLAQGFSMLASDRDGKSEDDTIAAFHNAVTAAPNDAVANYGLGYGQFFFSKFHKNKGERDQHLQDAITSLNKAIELRPNFFEALRVRGTCNHFLGNRNEAARDYEAANANRGSATDPDEVASVNVSQSVLLRQQAAGEKGERKQDLMNASDGYNEDAKEIARDLNIALRILRIGGFPSSLGSFLPRDLQGVFGQFNPFARFGL